MREKEQLSMEEKKNLPIKARQLLAALYVMHGHNWEEMYGAIRRKERHEDAEFLDAAAQINDEYISMVDDDYPQQFKGVAQPPFIVLFKGDRSAFGRKGMIYVACKDGRKPSPEALGRFGIDPAKAVWTEKANNHVHVGDDLEFWFDEADAGSARMGIAISSKVAILDPVDSNTAARIIAHALQQGIDVYAAPTPGPSVNNEAIKYGAYLLDRPDDLK